jgi:hypothetical protein
VIAGRRHEGHGHAGGAHPGGLGDRSIDEPEEGGGELAATSGDRRGDVLARDGGHGSQVRARFSGLSESGLHFDQATDPEQSRSHVVSNDAETQNEPVSWRGIVYDTPVFGSDGQRVGIVREVLGSDAEDIFHGLRIELDEGGRHVMILADDVTLITKGRIETGLASVGVAERPSYKEEETYHLASVGWLRKHLGWKRDSESDEEPGGTT